jgi:enoyl-CoA hydratase
VVEPTTTDEVVHFHTEGHVAIIEIDRPNARNAINTAVATSIERCIDEVEANDDLWVSVLTGAPPVFCAGADLKEIDAGNADLLSTKRGGFAGLTLRDRTKPLIAAVDGAALAGGMEIVLACDLVVASTNASFGLPEVKRSLAAAAGGLFRLGRKIPINIAMECVLTGDPISAERAFDVGIVNVLCASGEALDAALKLAERISANAPIAVRESMRVVRDGTNAPDADAWKLSGRAETIVMGSNDNTEGVRAFIEKRPPVWTGR